MRSVWVFALLGVACARPEGPTVDASSGPRAIVTSPVVVPVASASSSASVRAAGAWLVGRCNTVQVCLWSTKTGKARQWLQPNAVGGASELASVAFAENGKRIVIKTESGSTYRVDTASLH